MPLGQRAECGQVFAIGRDAARVVVDRLADHSGDGVPVPGKRLLQRPQIVPGQHQDEVRGGTREARGIGAGRDGRRAVPRRARGVEHHVVVEAVEMALEAEESLPPGGRPGNADGQGGGFHARGGETHHLGARHGLAHQGGEAGHVLRLAGRDHAHLDGLQDGLPRGGMVVAENRRAVGQIEVEVLRPVEPGEPRALAPDEVHGAPEAAVEPPPGTDAGRKIRLRIRMELVGGSKLCLDHDCTPPPVGTTAAVRRVATGGGLASHRHQSARRLPGRLLALWRGRGRQGDRRGEVAPDRRNHAGCVPRHPRLVHRLVVTLRPGQIDILLQLRVVEVRPDARPEEIDQPQEDLRSAIPVDRAMKCEVGLDVPPGGSLQVAGGLLEQGLCGRQRAIRPAGAGPLRGHRLKEESDLVQVPHLRLGEGVDPDAPIGLDDNNPFRLELPEGLPNRHQAHPELFGQSAEAQRLPRKNPRRDDLLPELIVNLLA